MSNSKKLIKLGAATLGAALILSIAVLGASLMYLGIEKSSRLTFTMGFAALIGAVGVAIIGIGEYLKEKRND